MQEEWKYARITEKVKGEEEWWEKNGREGYKSDANGRKGERKGI